LITLLAGFFAGFIHVLIGPDHLAALAPLATKNRQNNKSWLTGLRWGIGHTSGVLLIGALVLIFREIIPIDLVSTYSERVVGLVLVAIGIWALRKSGKEQIHTHQHSHNGTDHDHIHVHTTPSIHKHTHAALAVGTLHGLAGSSHILGIIPALALPSNILAAAYLTGFGLGTILGMILFSTLIGKLSNHFSENARYLYKGFTFTCAFSAIFIGLYWIWI
jgi:sulfite exporter TauE/SafE